jgi:8-oxo-dGTP diphosphatase
MGEVEKAAAPVDVAVGVMIRPDGRFLLAQRPAGKPMAGYWEFPGGKLEPGEDVLQALRREFQEELGVDIETAYPWAVREFNYPHARVRLHFWRAFRWHGEPQPLEQQALRWERLDDPCVEPWLPGALPLRRWLALPAQYAISHAQALGVPEFLARLDARAKTGQIKLLQLREKDLVEEEFAALFREVRARAFEFGFKLLVNSSHAEHFWHAAHGVHLTNAKLAACTARPSVQWCAGSCHDRAGLVQAAAVGLDFAVLGPVENSPSHRGSKPLGWPEFTAVCKNTTLPVYALGGLQSADLERARVAGAHGVASLRASWD